MIPQHANDLRLELGTKVKGHLGPKWNYVINDKNNGLMYVLHERKGLVLHVSVVEQQ